MAYTEDLEKAEHISDNELADKKLNYEALLAMVQQLPLAYRTVFNLFAIEGYGHDEIGEMLGISPGTSKSNLHKARQKLKAMILNAEKPYTGSGTGSVNYSSVMAINAVNMNGIFFNNGFRI